ncbi:MAG: RDD family protein [Thiomargarita sp.]|nr:RDD family protein [Thiomargarita sp.]
MEVSASLVRRLSAIVYDSLLLFSILFLAGCLAYPITQGNISVGYQIYLFSICFFYFAWSWVHGGQTLGMKAWRLQLQSTRSTQITWRQAWLRFIMSIISWLMCGIGFLWPKRTWHGWLSDTHMIVRAKKSRH